MLPCFKKGVRFSNDGTLLSKRLNCVTCTCNRVFLLLVQSPTFDHDSRHRGGLPFNVEG